MHYFCNLTLEKVNFPLRSDKSESILAKANEICYISFHLHPETNSLQGMPLQKRGLPGDGCKRDENTMLIEARQEHGITIIGPDLFSVDENGKPLGPIASIFPTYKVLIISRGIHSMHIETMVDFLKKSALFSQEDPGDEKRNAVYRDAVALFIREGTILIRSESEDMDRIFAVDALLQRLVPKERILFTGVHLPEVRRELRRYGQSWRISTPPRSPQEIERFIKSSQVHVGTRTTFYQSAASGERFLTYEEFMAIRSLMRQDRSEALVRLKEIVQLVHLINKQGVPELRFLLPAGIRLDTKLLEDLVSILQETDSPQNLERAERVFDIFGALFAQAAGPNLMVDGVHYPVWKTIMFCRLNGIDENAVEEWTLGLSAEFRLNIRWLPGARIVDALLQFEANVETRVRNLIEFFSHTWKGVLSINVGRVETSLTERDRTGEERDVYLIVLGLAEGREEIRLVRLMKWDVVHRLKRGVPREQAIWETFQYRDYVFDRIRATSFLDLPVPALNLVELQEDIPGLGPIPVFFFDRQYVPGIATDKIPPALYRQPGFIVRLSQLLGVAAAVSLVLGRESPRTGHVLFDDGDEVIQLEEGNLPTHLVITDITGAFADWSTPSGKLLPHCLFHIKRHLERAQKMGVDQENLKEAIRGFTNALIGEIDRYKKLLRDRPYDLRGLFADRPQEPGGVRSRWEGILNRIEMTDTDELRRIVAGNPELSLS